MAIHDIPSTYICNDLLARAKDPTQPKYFALETISIRPSAAWKLMQHKMIYKTDAPAHPFILYLEALKPQQLCIQLPIQDQHLEDSLVAQRSRSPRNWDDVSYVLSGIICVMPFESLMIAVVYLKIYLASLVFDVRISRSII